MSAGLVDALRLVTGWLVDAGVPWMIAGSFASTFHGEPRATQDIDIVIDPDEASLLRFVDCVPFESA